MSRSSPGSGPFRVAATVLAAVAAWLPARSIADFDDPQVLPETRFTINEGTFNQWAFGGRSVELARQRFDTLLTVKIEDLDRTCKLSDAQKRKLHLAGRGDMKRFDDQVDEARRKYVNLSHERSKLAQISTELSRFQRSFEEDPFDVGSIFAKTLKTTLTEAQAVAHDNSVREKVQYRFRSTVDLVVAMVDRSAGLSNEQRGAFRKLLLEETKPPRRFGTLDYHVVLWQAAKLPEAKIKPLFDDGQWRTLSRQFQQALRLEPTLVAGGYLPAGTVVSEPPPVPPARAVVQ